MFVYNLFRKMGLVSCIADFYLQWVIKASKRYKIAKSRFQIYSVSKILEHGFAHLFKYWNANSQYMQGKLTPRRWSLKWEDISVLDQLIWSCEHAHNQEVYADSITGEESESWLVSTESSSWGVGWWGCAQICYQEMAFHINTPYTTGIIITWWLYCRRN
jgi:hypothetical protein